MQQAAKLLAAMQLACHPRSCFYVCATGRIGTYIGIVTGDVGMPEYQHQCQSPRVRNGLASEQQKRSQVLGCLSLSVKELWHLQVQFQDANAMLQACLACRPSMVLSTREQVLEKKFCYPTSAHLLMAWSPILKHRRSRLGSLLPVSKKKGNFKHINP